MRPTVHVLPARLAVRVHDDSHPIKRTVHAHGVIFAPLSAKIQRLLHSCLRSTIGNGSHFFHGGLVEDPIDPAPVEERRLHARENDLETFVQQGVEAFHAVHLPEREVASHSSSGLFATSFYPISLHGAHEIHISGANDLDPAFVPDPSHPVHVRLHVIDSALGYVHKKQRKAYADGLRFHEGYGVRSKGVFLRSEAYQVSNVESGIAFRMKER
mmetsp:Transcript_54157/g.115078  ORF Transcript_54157/g.115078 Transcript_54157/m.115078 type:complete len:214 (-) Transcript_54157:95-736(-)